MLIGISNVINAQCIPVPCTYSTSTVPFALSPVGTNSVVACDDCLSTPVNIGFPFGFMCNTYSTVIIGSNGFISFDPTITTSGCCSGGTIPSATSPNGVVALFWTDLYNSVSNSITYRTIGIAPNRTFVVTYSAVPVCCGTSFPHTGQIKLFETSGIIELHMASVPNGGNTLTQGIENVAGTAGYTTSVMAATGFSATNLAYRYTPVTTNTAVMIPSFPSAITGPTNICSGVATFSVAGGSGATAYNWSLPAGFAGTSTTNIISPTVTASGTPSLSLTFSCGTISSPGNPVVVGIPTLAVSNGTICTGNSFTISPTGASSYTFSGGTAVVSPTTTTSYTITGSNGPSCLASNTVVCTVSVNPGTTPTVSVSGASVACPSATNILTASGASTYLWSTGATTSTIIVSPPVSTAYNVVGTSTNGCSNAFSKTVTVTPNPTIIVNSGFLCIGSSFTMVPGGATNYTFSSGSAVVSPTVNTTYSVVGTSSIGCVGTNTAISSVSINPLPIVTVNSGSVCAGRSFTINPSGANTYSFSGGSAVVSPTITTSYIVTGTSTLTSCSNTVSSLVIVYDLPNVLLTPNSNTACINSGSISLVGFPSGGVYAGSNVVGNVFTPGAVAGTFLATYSYTTPTSGCTNTTSATIIVNSCVGIKTNNAGNSLISLYPNPTNGIVTIELPVTTKVTVTNVLGKIIFTENLNAGVQTIDISNQSNGIYFVKFNEFGKKQSIKLIKE
jgi:hypothetical protein